MIVYIQDEDGAVYRHTRLVETDVTYRALAAGQFRCTGRRRKPRAARRYLREIEYEARGTRRVIWVAEDDLQRLEEQHEGMGTDPKAD